MPDLRLLLIPLGMLVVGAVIGVSVGWSRERRARRADARASRGRALTVPMLVTATGTDRRARGVVDGATLRVIGPRTHLVLAGDTWGSAGHRRHHVDDELAELSLQRAYVDPAGATYQLGPHAEWEAPLSTALAHPGRGRASRRRLWWAAVPRALAAGCVAAAAGLLAFQAVWASGHDATATLVLVVGPHGDETCAVRWDGGTHYAEVECYEPFPAVGSPVVVRALGSPFAGRAMDTEGTYEGLTVIPGVLCLVLGVGTVAQTVARVRRPPVELAPLVQDAPTRDHDGGEPAVGAHGDSLRALLDAVSTIELWSDGVTPAPEQQPHARLVLAASSARWWPTVTLTAAAVILDMLPDPVRLALGAGAVAALLWGAYRVLSTWFALRPAYDDPVTSEWDYRLWRMVTDEWVAMLQLGDRPHWMVELAGPGHPPPAGRCGVRGDLRDGGAVQLRIGADFWMTAAPVSRVDDDLLEEVREDLRERLGELAEPGARDVGGAPTG